MDNLLVAIIAGLLIVAIFFWNNQGSKTKKEETQATPQVEEKSAVQETTKKKKKRQRKRSKKKGKQQKDEKAAPQVDTKEPEAKKKNSNNKSKQQNKSKKKASAPKKKASAPKKKGSAPASAPKKQAPKKQSPPDAGGGWITAGQKKKKKQPRGGFDPNAQAQNVTNYVVPTRKIGILIGPKGKTLRAIEEKAGCKIKMPADRNASRKDATVTIIGEAQQRSVGKAIIKDLVELGFSARLQAGMKMHNVAVSKSLLPVLRGNKFAALKALEADGNVKISIPETMSSGSKCRIKVAGTMRGIEKTKKSLTQLNLHYHCEATHPGFVHKELYNCDISLIVGPGGQTIKSIQGDTKAKIYTPKSGSANQNVVIVGTKAQVIKALNQVQRVLGTDLKTLTTKAAPPPADDDFYMVEQEDVDGYTN